MPRATIPTPKILPYTIFASIFPAREKNLAAITNAFTKPDRKFTEQEQIKQAFFGPHLIALEDRAKFRQALRVLGAMDLEKILYGNAEDKLEAPPVYPFPSNTEIGAIFDKLEAMYGFFAKKEEEKLEFIKLFKTTKIIADFIEKNNDAENSVAAEHAYKMLVVFGQIKEKGKGATKEPLLAFEQYLKINGQNMRAPLHDVLQYPLPKGPAIKDKIHLNAWRKFIQVQGKKVFEYFANAEKIEAMLFSMDEIASKKSEEITPHKEEKKEEKQFFAKSKTVQPFRAPITLDELRLADAKCLFKRTEENLELAKICKEWRLTEKDFDKCLSVLEKRREEEKKESKSYKNNLPTVEIAGAKFSESVDARGCYLVKLPENDYNGFVLGKITNCCQSIGGHSEQCVIDGMTIKNNGFYVLLEPKDDTAEKKPFDEKGHINYEHFTIVGQGYAWRTKSDNLVFDSWENKTPAKYDKIVVEMLKHFAKTVVDDEKNNIGRVTIGKGGKTPGAYQILPDTYAEAILDGNKYGDSTRQAEIYINQSQQNLLKPKLTRLLETINADEKISIEEKKSISTWLISSCYTADFVDTMQFFYEHVPQFFVKQYQNIRNKNLPVLLLLFDVRLKNHPLFVEKIFKLYPHLEDVIEVAQLADEEKTFADIRLLNRITKEKDRQKMLLLIKNIIKIKKQLKAQKLDSEGAIALLSSNNLNSLNLTFILAIFDHNKNQIDDEQECIAFTNDLMSAMAWYLNASEASYDNSLSLMTSFFKSSLPVKKDFISSCQLLQKEAKNISFLYLEPRFSSIIDHTKQISVLIANEIKLTRHITFFSQDGVDKIVDYFKVLREKKLDIPIMQPDAEWSYEEAMEKIVAMELMKQEKIDEDKNMLLMWKLFPQEINDIVAEFKLEKSKLSLSSSSSTIGFFKPSELLKNIIVKYLLKQSSSNLFSESLRSFDLARQLILLIVQNPLLLQKFLDVSKEEKQITDPLQNLIHVHPDIPELRALIEEREALMHAPKKTKTTDKKSESTSSKKKPSKFILTKGKDTTREDLRETSTLALSFAERESFFAKSAKLLSLLKEHPENPLLEEGKYVTDENREHAGEFFITADATALLIAHYANKYAEKNAENKLEIGSRVKNIFVFNNNLSTFGNKLRELDLKPNEDAKIIYVIGRHAIPIYLRNHDGKINCFIADSEGGDPTTGQFILDNIKEANVVLGPPLQKDFFSCFTFAIKAIRYFIKYGDEVFPHIDKVGTTKNGKFRQLSRENLMPPLLKLTQYAVELSPEAAATIVSRKMKKSLEDYFEEYKEEFGSKILNTAAIDKKYKYLTKINEMLENINPTDLKNMVKPYM